MTQMPPTSYFASQAHRPYLYLVSAGRMLHPAPAAAPAVAVYYSSSYHASPPQIPASLLRRHRPAIAVRCTPDGSRAAPDVAAKEKLKVGSPIVIVEAPPMLKTAASVPSLRRNGGHVKPGDVGRIMARKPKDVWAVRLAVGTYLLDGRHFKPLEVVDDKGDDESQDE